MPRKCALLYHAWWMVEIGGVEYISKCLSIRYIDNSYTQAPYLSPLLKSV